MERYKLDQYPFARTPISALYRCKDTVGGESLAVKVVDRRTTSGERRVQRVLEGAEAISRAGPHPGIVGVRGVYEVDKKAYIVMEYVAGGTLLDYVKRKGPIREASVVPIVRQLLFALVHLHSFGVMHRDLKTENILIRLPTDLKSPPEKVCICDFGFATVKCPNSECVGSPQYSAPEIALIGMTQGKTHANSYSYDEKCDVWSLGVVTYALLSGMLPFDGSTPREVFENILQKNISFSHPLWSDVSEEGRRFILFLMTPEASKRPSSREALRHPWLQM
ncbi:Protein kinase domain [Trypanosoma melophagium]|uniref:Protein kinase domain n=1 Tax=Trypanosoma melophagium TaxID=715481 RepID=UPI00351A1C5D|nr:Protein kinase domain [Trypanosoma melophagium]